MSTISAGTTTPTALSLSGDTTGALTFQVNGTTTAATVTSAGNVGIGTTSPQKKFVVSDAGNIGIELSPNDGGTSLSRLFSYNRATAAYVPFVFQGDNIQFGTGSAATERMRIDSSGNVGIGRTAYGNLTTNGVWLSPGTDGLYHFGCNTANGVMYINQNGSGPILSVNKSGSEVFAIANAGSTFVKRSSALYGEDFSVAGYAVIGSSTAGLGQAIIGSDGSTGINGTVDNVAYVTRTNNTERMRVTAGGNVGIGTASPASQLHITASTDPKITIQGDAANGFAYIDFTAESGNLTKARINSTRDGVNGGRLIFSRANSSGTVTEAMRIVPDGEVYIAGTTDQGAYNLQVNGTGVWGAGAYVNGSDARLKDNIQSLDSGLDVVKAMRPVTFQYKPEYSKDQSVQPGFIAQELQEAMAGKNYLDGVVQSGPEYLNVAYQNIIPILVKAIQELEAKVAALESK